MSLSDAMKEQIITMHKQGFKPGEISYYTNAEVSAICSLLYPQKNKPKKKGRKVEETPELIESIRQMRSKGCQELVICNALGVGLKMVKEHTKDMGPLPRKPNLNEFNHQAPVYKTFLSKLSLEDQQKYNNCKPAEKPTRNTYIEADKQDYGNANVFQRCSGTKIS